MGSLGTPEMLKQTYGSSILSEISNLDTYQAKLKNLTASKTLTSKNKEVLSAMEISTAELVAGMRKENEKRQKAEADAIVSGWKDADASAKMASADAARTKAKLDAKNKSILSAMDASTAELVAGMRKQNAQRQKAEADAIISDWKDADASAKMASADALKIKKALDAQNKSILAAMDTSTNELVASMRKENEKRQKAEAAILSASNKFLDGDAKTQARTTLVAAKRINSGRDTSLMAPEAVSSAQMLGSVDAAQAARYPSFSLGGSVGLTALTLAGLSNGATVATTVLASMSVPLLDGGAANARVQVQQSVADQALANYQNTLLTAVKDVADAMAGWRSDQESLVHLQQAATAADNAALLAKDRYASGLIDFQTVLQTQRTLLSAQDGLASGQAALSTDFVRLVKAVGGGWH